MTDASKCKLLMDNFTTHPEFKLDDYYGVTIMTIKKDRKFSIQLQYGYAKKAQNSSSLIIDGVEKALETYRILMKFAIPLKIINNEPDLSFLNI